ncbi:hypothetical protein C2G38_1999075 [Gigaspora rosea]|uniref:Protein kinase domain-containing protein n=1 Tax=Gigaspora rosea TaxID=44941 RepID=A0A397VR79_9GLOM|nr:hypothetical protein C2G38_1999075 [Gigaspora rosea]
MVLQFANNGNLREYLRKNFVKLQWADKFRIASEIVHGIMFLHNVNIIHRDLHSMNILIHQGQIKIADFGLAKQINETSMVSNSAINGITPYIDPQCLINHKYKRNKKSDIYSLGVILWEISSGRPPFQSFELREALAVHIFLGNREEPIEGTPPQYVKLYKQCWDKDPSIRPEARTVFAVLNELNSNEESTQNNDSFTNQDYIVQSNVSSNFELQNNESQNNIKMQSDAIPPDLSNTIDFDIQNTSMHYDYSLEKKRKEVHKCLSEGCYVKALELYEEILADNLHNSMDRHNASNWNISSKNIDSKEMDELMEAICKNTILTSLDLRYSKFGSKEERALAKALCKNTTLTSLNLGYIQPGFKEGKSLAEALCKNTNLTSLNLRYNQLGPEEGKALAKALYKNTTLTSLDISSNYIGSEGGKALANALCNNSTLNFLDLTENQLSSQGGKALAEALCKNTTLTTLNLAENQLGPVGGEALANALCKNTALTYLNLYNNQLYSKGGKH